MATRNNIPVTTLAKPVRAPTETPDALSIYVVTVDVPNTAPAIVPTESANRARLALGSLPLLSRKPAFSDTPTRVPIVSKRSTKRKAKTKPIRPTSKAAGSSRTALPNRLDGQVGRSNTPVGKGVWPISIEISATPITPISIAPFAPLTSNTPIPSIPSISMPTDTLLTSPSDTSVCSFASTIPAFFNPMKAINKPMPAAEACFRASGTALIKASLTRASVSAVNRIPEAKTTPRTWS